MYVYELNKTNLSIGVIGYGFGFPCSFWQSCLYGTLNPLDSYCPCHSLLPIRRIYCLVSKHKSPPLHAIEAAVE